MMIILLINSFKLIILLKMQTFKEPFESGLQQDLQKMNKRAKEQYRKRQRSVLIKHTPHKPQIKQLIKINMSLNYIRDSEKKQTYFQQGVNNRFMYLSHQKAKKCQAAELAKIKYQKIIQVRKQTFREKSAIIKERNSFKKKYQREVKSKVNKIKQEKQKTQYSLQKWKSQTFSSAQSMRRNKMVNETMIENQKQETIRQKQLKFKKTKQQQQRIHRKLKQLQSSRIEAGKVNHRQKVYEHYRQLRSHSQKNAALIKKMQKQILKINTQKLKAVEELKQYQSFLGIRRPLTSHQNPERHSQNHNKSFYITNY